jgi:hypothetical protein
LEQRRLQISYEDGRRHYSRFFSGNILRLFIIPEGDETCMPQGFLSGGYSQAELELAGAGFTSFANTDRASGQVETLERRAGGSATGVRYESANVI